MTNQTNNKQSEKNMKKSTTQEMYEKANQPKGKARVIAEILGKGLITTGSVIAGAYCLTELANSPLSQPSVALKSDGKGGFNLQNNSPEVKTSDVLKDVARIAGLGISAGVGAVSVLSTVESIDELINKNQELSAWEKELKDQKKSA